jgi:hypothetical protein
MSVIHIGHLHSSRGAAKSTIAFCRGNREFGLTECVSPVIYLQS